MRDGYDVVSPTIRNIETVTINKSNYVASEKCIDFSLIGEIGGVSEWTEGRELQVLAGLQTADLLRVRNISGKFVFEGYANGSHVVAGVKIYSTASTGVDIPSSNFKLEISAMGGVARLMLWPDAGTRTVIAEFPVVRHGGRFIPQVNWTDDATASPFSSITYNCGYGDTQYKKLVNDKKIWNVSTLTADVKPVYGGNGINHYSTQGIDTVVRPTIEAVNLSADGYTSGKHLPSGGNWVKYVDGTAIFTKRVTIETSITTEYGSIFVQGSGQTDTSFPQDLFYKYSDLSFEFCTAFHILSSTTNFVWVVSNGVSSLNNAIRYRLAAAVSLPDTTVHLQITMTGRWKL
jgi:hypothetical protein